MPDLQSLPVLTENLSAMAMDGLTSANQPNGIKIDGLQRRSRQSELECIRFLKLHLKRGGLSKKGYDILFRMILMISAIGWELHVVYSSKIPSATVRAKMEQYISCILEGCGAFIRNMKAAADRAIVARDAFPVAFETRAELRSRLDLWRKSFR